MNLDSLNDKQKEAVLIKNGPSLVIAGAGSGKTKVLTYKIAYLIESGVSPTNILAITFTNKAALEMKNRVIDLVGENARYIFMSTFHKFCGMLLRNSIDVLGYDRNFSVINILDQRKLMSQIIKDLNIGKLNEKAVLSVISDCKNHKISIEEYEKNAKSAMEKNYVKCFKEYEDRKFKQNTIDFDDMLVLAVKVLKMDKEFLSKVNERFKYILVDEYQDTNQVQFDLIKLLTTKYDNLTVVGDEDQSIYKFRGADITNILSFEETFKNANVVKLTKNYRSTQNILNVANSIISNNLERKPKEMWSDNKEGFKVSFIEYLNDKEEAKNIITNIKRDNDLSNTAILYRTNAQSRIFEEFCVQQSIPYKIINATNFYDRKEVMDMLAYLKLVSNNKDNISLLRIINVPRRGLGDAALNKINLYAEKNNLSLFSALENYNDLDFTNKSLNSVKKFVDDINNIEKFDLVNLMIEYIINDMGYKDYLISEYGDIEAEDRLANILELKNKSLLYDKSEEYKDFSGLDKLREFLYDISLVSDTDSLMDENNMLTLMTLHASKGLEYDNVYIVGLNEGILPSSQTINSLDVSLIEEERRLCYVGITRAKKKLFLSSASQRLINGSFSNYPISRFIYEIDDQMIDKKVLSTIQKTNNNYFLNFDIPFRREYKKNFNYSNKDFVSERKKSDESFMNNMKTNISSYNIGKDIKKIEKLSYGVGDRVSHIKYGEGEVINIKDIGRDYEITVSFDEFGEKTLFATFGKLEKI